jgi:adenylylsulfate kinase-like enzyme
VRNLAGVHFPYEEPIDPPDVSLDTDRRDTMTCVSKILDYRFKNDS